ncbi:unnamed protein product [Parajaminaea phylloscopi]
MAPIATRPDEGVERPSKSTNGNQSLSSAAASPLIDLYSGTAADDLRSGVIAGLKGHDTLIVPGSTQRPEDIEWAYRKTLPTTLLYDENGLKIYDELVEVPEYYLWNAEKSILETHGKEIAFRLFGHQTEATEKLLQRTVGEEEARKQQRKHHKKDRQDKEAPVFDGLNHEEYTTANEKWGDFRVGKHNGGVNSEHGLDDGGGSESASSAAVVELGAGSLRKTIHLLRGLGQLPGLAKQHPVRYYALDLDKSELMRTLTDLRAALGGSGAGHNKEDPWAILDGKLTVSGLWATYDQGLAHIGAGDLDQDTSGQRSARSLLWLGSSIGNFERRDAAEFLKGMADKAMRAGDKILVGIDRRNAPRDIELAYNDPKGVTEAFIMNGLKHADRILGGQGVLDASKFEYRDRYNVVEGRHESYYRSRVEQTLSLPDGTSVSLEAGELIHIERSYKYSEREVLDALDHAGLRLVQKWTSELAGPKYDLWLVEKPVFHFRSTRLLTGWRDQLARGLSVAEAHNDNGSHEYDADGGSSAEELGSQPKGHNLWGSWGMPSLEQWDASWKSWDTITLTMISRKMLHQKPIDLRHICLFYLGHIPTFVDIFITKVMPDLKPLEERYNQIFERGIDPHVDDPTQCHTHSEVPEKEEDWPKVEEILAYRERLMDRLRSVYQQFGTGERTLDRHIARALKMAQEHIDLHQETLLYMLAQSDDTLPPAGFALPDWASLARQWDLEDELSGGEVARTALLNFKADSVTIGHDDDEYDDRNHKVLKPTPDIKKLNKELGNPAFGWDNEQPARIERTGAFSISAAPVSNEQYLRFLTETKSEDVPSSWVRGPLEGNEAYLIRTVFGPVPMSVARLWPVQGSGNQLRRYADWVGGRLPTHAELRRFLDSKSSPICVDRPGTNVGFRNWHPVPPVVAQSGGGAGSGLPLPGHNGGVWEWTSTAFAAHQGFKPSILYPGYSSDFHDGKHDVVLGGSWATTPSLAGRKTVNNTYQRDYPYSFIGGRVVFDSQTKRKVSSVRRSDPPPPAQRLVDGARV